MHRVHSEEISREEKRALWDEIIADYLSCNESGAAYCARHGLKLDNFYYYVSSYQRKRSAVNPFIPIETRSIARSTLGIEINSGPLQISLPADVSLVILDAVIKRMLQC